ncbi:MAG: copper resistance protein CopC, partial [Acidimicrobiia bacterium]|nr:copper resistance protein CopC [Acidimicrobiia bacterium]
MSRTSPAEIDVFFTQTLDYPYCKVVLVGPDGHNVATHEVHAGSPTELAVVPNHPLDTEGSYVAAWTAVGDDGHTVIGSFVLSVGHPSAHAAATQTAAPSAGSAVGRGFATETLQALLPLTIVLLVGLLVLRTSLAGVVAAEEDVDRRRRVGRRVVLAFRVAWVAAAVVTTALIARAIVTAGWSDFGSAATGRRLELLLFLTTAAAPLALDPGVGDGRRPTRARITVALGVALGLLGVLAASG